MSNLRETVPFFFINWLPILIVCSVHELEIVWISLCAPSWIERNIRIFMTEFISHEYVRNAKTAGAGRRPRLSLCHFFCPTEKGENSLSKYFSRMFKVWVLTLATRKSKHFSWRYWKGNILFSSFTFWGLGRHVKKLVQSKMTKH